MKLRFYIKSFDKKLLQSVIKNLISILTETECQITGSVALPIKIKKFCVLRSPHIDKDSREQFEIRIYKQFFDLLSPSPEVIDSIFKLDMPSGVCCSIKVIN